MIRLTRSQVQPIGLDIGRDSIKMLQVEVVGGQSLEVRAAQHRAFGAEAKAQPPLRLALAGGMVRDMLRQGGFTGRRVVAALPREIVHIKNFRLPMMPVEDLESAVRFETRQLFGFEPSEAMVQCLPAGEVRQGGDTLQEVIVLAVRNDDVAGFVEQLHRCGVEIESLDAQACALYRTVERFIRRRDDEHLVNVLVDVGLSSSQIVIGRGREITFTKTAEIGGMHFHEAISRKLEIPVDEAQALRCRLLDAAEPVEGAAPQANDPVRQAVFDAARSVMEQLGQEVLLCLRYQSVTFRGQRPGRLKLLGGEARDAQLQATLGSMVGIQVELGRPLINVDTSRMQASDRRGPMSQWAVALGLALKRTAGRFGNRDGTTRAMAAAERAAAPEPGSDAAGVPALVGAGVPAGREASHA